MKIKKIIIAIMLIVVSINVGAQTKENEISERKIGQASGINVSVTPLGGARLSIHNGDYVNHYDFRSLFSVEISKEGALGSMNSLIYLLYSHAKMDDFKRGIESPNLVPNDDDTYNSISLGFTFGQTLNPYGRIKFPIFIGPVLAYEKFGPIHNLTINMLGKVRMKYFITPKIGIFIGATARYGGGYKKPEKYGVETKEAGDKLSVTTLQYGLETGLSIGIN